MRASGARTGAAVTDRRVIAVTTVHVMRMKSSSSVTLITLVNGTRVHLHHVDRDWRWLLLRIPWHRTAQPHTAANAEPPGTARVFASSRRASDWRRRIGSGVEVEATSVRSTDLTLPALPPSRDGGFFFACMPGAGRLKRWHAEPCIPRKLRHCRAGRRWR